MKLTTAIGVFRSLEVERDPLDERPKSESQPLWNVRLDADDNTCGERTYRLFVRSARQLGPDNWEQIIALARGNDLAIAIENAGIALT